MVTILLWENEEEVIKVRVYISILFICINVETDILWSLLMTLKI